MLLYFTRLRIWSRRVVTWLWRARELWLGLVIPVAVLFLCVLSFSEWERRLRFTGLLLELFGVGVVAWGLRETRKVFNRPTLRQLAKAWWRGRPRWRSVIAAAAGGAALVTAKATLSGVGTTGLPPHATLEDRIKRLEGRANETDTAISTLRQQVHAASDEQRTALRKEQEERAQEDKKTRTQLESAMAGGLYLELVGVWWLMLGVVLATASRELADCIVSWLRS